MVAGENLLRDPSDVPTKDFARDVPAQCFEFTYTYLPRRACGLERSFWCAMQMNTHLIDPHVCLALHDRLVWHAAPFVRVTEYVADTHADLCGAPISFT